MATIRQLKDANFIYDLYLPAAGLLLQSATIDLGAISGDPDPSLFDVNVDIPAMPNHTDPTKTITVTVQDSADDAVYANVVPLMQIQIPGVAGNGSPAQSVPFRLPPTVRRYVQLQCSVPAGDGDVTGCMMETSLLF